MAEAVTSDVVNAKAQAELPVWDCSMTVERVPGLTPARVRKALRAKMDVPGMADQPRFPEVGAIDVLPVSGDLLLIEFELSSTGHVTTVVTRAWAIASEACAAALGGRTGPDAVAIAARLA